MFLFHMLFFLIVLIIHKFLLSTTDPIVSLTETPNKNIQNHYICWDNRADVIVELENGDTYAFRHDQSWKLHIHDFNQLISINGPHFNSDLFPKLPPDIELGFTMPRINKRLQDRLAALPGMTLFLKPPNYFLYRNYQLFRIELTQYWETGPFVDNRFVATLHNTSLLLVAKQGIIPDGIKIFIGGQVFLFDSDRFPELIGVFRIESKYKHKFNWLKLRQLIPINSGYSDNNDSYYLALFDYGLTDGQHYCILKIDNEYYGKCDNNKLRPLSDAFQCPRKLIELKLSNFYYIWKLTGLPFGLIIFGALGVSMALLIINSILLINTCNLFQTLNTLSFQEMIQYYDLGRYFLWYKGIFHCRSRITYNSNSNSERLRMSSPYKSTSNSGLQTRNRHSLVNEK